MQFGTVFQKMGIFGTKRAIVKETGEILVKFDIVTHHAKFLLKFKFSLKCNCKINT